MAAVSSFGRVRLVKRAGDALLSARAFKPHSPGHHVRALMTSSSSSGHQGQSSYESGSSSGGGSGGSAPRKGLSCLLAATAGAAGFSFAEHGVRDDECSDATDNSAFDESKLAAAGWERLDSSAGDAVRVHRRLVPGPYTMYEYRCAGTYKDISAREFLDAQMDVAYRSEWDSNIITLEQLADDGKQQLIRWVSRYPYPMYAREYVYVRRAWVSSDGGYVVVHSQALDEKVVPVSGKNVRVNKYVSRMTVRVHDKYNKPGLDYVLTYFDNPEANIPTYVYNWIVNQGGPYFLQQVHKAAAVLRESGREVRHAVTFPRVEKSEEEEERRKAELIPLGSPSLDKHDKHRHTARA